MWVCPTTEVHCNDFHLFELTYLQEQYLTTGEAAGVTCQLPVTPTDSSVKNLKSVST